MEQNLVEETRIKNKMNEALFKFALTSLHKYMRMNPKNDIVFSPYNLYQGLFSVYLICTGYIKDNLKEVLYLNEESKDDLMTYINFDKFVQRYLHYRIENIHIKPDYENLNRCTILNSTFCVNLAPMNKIFNNGFVSSDSNHVEDANEMINKDIQRVTENHFCNTMKLKVTRNILNIVLMTTNYFHGNNLSIADPSTNVSTIPAKLKCKSFFNNELNVVVNEFPITEHITSLYMLFPVSLLSNTKVRPDISKTSLFDLINRLSTDEGICRLRNLLDTCIKTQFQTSFSTRPIFEIERDLNMRELLRALNVEQLLLPYAIYLDSSVTKNKESVHFGNAVHRARVKVTEDDVKAAAITLITGQESCSSKSLINVNFNFPFLYMIYDRVHRDILYLGVFNEFDEPLSEITIDIYQTSQTNYLPPEMQQLRLERERDLTFMKIINLNEN